MSSETDLTREVAKLLVDFSDACYQRDTALANVAKLREALEQIIADCEADYPPSHGAIKYRARAVLDETGGVE